MMIHSHRIGLQSYALGIPFATRYKSLRRKIRDSVLIHASVSKRSILRVQLFMKEFWSITFHHLARVRIIVVAVVFASFFTFASIASCEEIVTTPTSIVLRQGWRTNSGNLLTVKIVQTGSGRYRMEFINGDNTVYSVSVPPSDLGSYPDSMFILDDGNLASLWTSGGPYFILNVFSFRGGKVQRVLRESSKARPELVYSTDSVFDTDKIKANGYQRIIVSKSTWSQITPRVLKQVLSTANIYWWNEKKGIYSSERNVIWKNRLLVRRTH